ncbi:MAG: 30S ribosomal protein S20 [Gammaproteobacteria bacterium]|nr:30S ribosomal protein S20 [Gammaproteobacteria bacterium]
MANSAQAKKRARQNDARRRRNASQRSAFRTAIKKTLAAAENGSYDEASSAYKVAIPIIDKAVTHGLIQKNKAARHKSRLNAKVKALQS